MQIVIEISKEDYKEVLQDTYSGTPFENRVFSAIQNGTPIPDNVTNGDEIEVLFKNDKFELKTVDYSEYGDPNRSG